MPEVIEIAELTEELAPFQPEITMASESSASIEQEYETLNESQKENFAEAIENIKSGEVPENPGVKEQYDRIMEKLKASSKALSDFMTKYLGKEVIIDPTKPFGQQSQATKEVVAETIQKMTKGNPEAFDTFLSGLDEQNVVSNPEKYTTYQRGRDALAAASIAVAALGTIAKFTFNAAITKSILDKIAEDMSGCTRMQSGSEKSKILKSCKKDKELPNACNCPGDFDKLQSLCSEIKDDETCTNGYTYKYVHLTWIDALSALIGGITDAAAAAAEGGLSIFKFLTKYGIYVAFGILLLFMIPQVIKIMSTIPRKNGPPTAT